MLPEMANRDDLACFGLFCLLSFPFNWPCCGDGNIFIQPSYCPVRGHLSVASVLPGKTVALN